MFSFAGCFTNYSYNSLFLLVKSSLSTLMARVTEDMTNSFNVVEYYEYILSYLNKVSAKLWLVNSVIITLERKLTSNFWLFDLFQYYSMSWLTLLIFAPIVNKTTKTSLLSYDWLPGQSWVSCICYKWILISIFGIKRYLLSQWSGTLALKCKIPTI